MDQALKDIALPRLRRALGLTEGEDEQRLEDALAAAEEKICRYLLQSELPDAVDCLLVELAALVYLRTGERSALKSESYSEGQLSQSQSYLTAEELAQGEEALLRCLAPWRRVRCKGGASS
ncbi:MAG: hypothetical protein IJ751_03980 [Oscillospiraceae bacterium]|nr:hypothetical protein [Oscillospiraceae bacterium]